MRYRSFLVAGLVAWVAGWGVTAPARALIIANPHVVDGLFNASNASVVEFPEWASTRNTVSKSFFQVVGQAGGAYLYAEQDFGKLYLMYDYINSTSLGLNGTNSFFDVFFQVAPEKTDYVVRISPGTNSFQAFEKPTGTVDPLDANGNFQINNPSIWTPLTPADLSLAGFQSAIGFGKSPNSPTTDHLMAEFALTINSSSDPNNPNGLYSPDPAFWSASVSAPRRVDPPITSGIFSLNPNGTTTITPVFASNGGPAQQPQDVAPEPSSLTLVGIGAVGLAVGAWWRRKRSLLPKIA